jgi:hypothetical protein
MTPDHKPTTVADGVLVGEFDVHIKGNRLDCTLPARFFQNYQREHSVWGEVLPTAPQWLAAAEVEITSPGHLEPFPAVLGGLRGTQANGALVFSAELIPLRDPIESAPAKEVKEVTFALLDSPVTENLVREQRPGVVTFPCGQFDISLTDPTTAHCEIADILGSSPHVLSNSGTIRERNGQVFSSNAARIALDTMHDALSFAAGRWVGITLVHAVNAAGEPVWFRWGAGRMSAASSQSSWYDPGHTEWIQPLCNGLLQAKSNEETWEPIRTALYWYVRSNTRGAGIDSSLILSQCALELLSWFVIVKRTAALSEQGYSQLSSASEKLRLTLTLLGIPRQIPTGLKKVVALRKDWRDVAEAVVQARNYLVHPTQSRSGKRRTLRNYPWHELWIAGQWLLELVILRLLGYTGNYRNRTRLTDFDPIERVPWT